MAVIRNDVYQELNKSCLRCIRTLSRHGLACEYLMTFLEYKLSEQHENRHL